jgi:hypothetical protein
MSGLLLVLDQGRVKCPSAVNLRTTGFESGDCRGVDNPIHGAQGHPRGDGPEIVS